MTTTAPKDDLPEARILPCPFCGGEAKHFKYYNNEGIADKFRVSCSSCGAIKDAFKLTPEDAAVSWNTRTPAIADGAEWQSMESAPRNEVLFVCRRKSKPHVTFEACLFEEQESWEIPEMYLVFQNMTTDEPLDGDWSDFEWRPLPQAATDEGV